MSTNKKRNA